MGLQVQEKKGVELTGRVTREGERLGERERLVYPFLLLRVFAPAVRISSTGLPWGVCR